MTMRAGSLLFLLSLAVAAFPARAIAAAQGPVPEVAVMGLRVHVGDLVAGVPSAVAAIDLGPSPAAGGSRIVDRAEIAAAFQAHDLEAPLRMPTSVRILRKMKQLEVADIERIVREGLEPKLRRGVSVSAVHPQGAVSVPDGWTAITTEIPRPPRRKGPLACDASVSFVENSQVIRMMSVPVELMLSAEAAVADVVHGTRLTLLIRRGLVEVTTLGTAASDADIGDLVPVVVHPSGRTIMAHLEDAEHAVALSTQ